jgi:Predicted membrane protein
MDPDHSQALEAQVAELRSRVWELEQALLSHGILQPPVVAQAAVEAEVAGPPTRTQPSIPEFPTAIPEGVHPLPPREVPTFAAQYSSPAVDVQSLESRIGSQWFNRVGILAVLIAMAWFLKFAIDNHWIGPLGRVLIGLLVGGGLVAWSERFRSRGYAVFSYSLKAIGSGVLYLSLWAAFSLYHLVPASVAFVAMVLVTAFNGFMAWVQDAELLALYAIVGGVSTPLLLSTGENHEVTLFTYLLVIDMAVLVLAALKPWSRLIFMAFLSSLMFYLAWSFAYYSNGQALRTAFFLACFFLVFAFAPRMVLRRRDDDTQIAGWDGLALVLLPLANAAWGFLGFYAILDRPGSDWAHAWLAVAFAAFYLLLLRLPENTQLRSSPVVLSGLHLALAVVFLTIAIPLKAHGRWITTGWLVEGTALLWVARRNGSLLLRALAVLCTVLGLCSLVVIDSTVSLTPILNARFATYCVAIAACAFAGWVSASPGDGDAPAGLGWTELAAVAVLAVNALILIAVGLEIHNYWWNLRWASGQDYMQYRMYAQFTYSAWFMLFGAALLAVGFWRRSSFLRWQALVLLAFAIGKVFLVDVSELSQGYRILSFLGLGALLLGVSFVYQRDWLNLRGRAEVDKTEVPGGGSR